MSRGFLMLNLHRLKHWQCNVKSHSAIATLTKIPIGIGKYLVQIITKADILPSTVIDPEVYLSNKGHIILGAKSVGTGTFIHHQVTIGMNLADAEVPTIGRQVWIGPQSIIYGNVCIGDGATILPHTVITKSIPAKTVVQGNPARLIVRNFDNAALRSTLITNINSHDIINSKEYECSTKSAKT
jgi:serine O-acetyltransferase